MGEQPLSEAWLIDAASPKPKGRPRHPGHLTVGDVMTHAPLVFPQDLPIQLVAHSLSQAGLGGAPVIDADGRPIGVLSRADLIAREASPRTHRGLLQREQIRRRLATTAGEACSRPALTVRPATSLKEAARELLDRDVGRLVVVDEDGRVVGILTQGDVLPALTRSNAALTQLINQELAAAGITGVGVRVCGVGRVTLTGRVADCKVAAHALRAAEVDGVTEVHNGLTVAAPVEDPGW